MKPLSWYRETYIRDRYKCVYCGRDMKDRFDDWMSLEIDHLIPVSKGRDDSLDNRVTSCHVCNRFKSNFLPENYKSLSRDELVDKIREYILGKRKEWEDEHQKALIEFDEALGK